MPFIRPALAAFAILAAGTSPAALSAQATEQTPPPTDASEAATRDTVFDDTWLAIGIGIGVKPSYDGSNNYVAIPAPAFRGKVAGFDFGSRGPGLYVDLIRDREDASVNLIAGPVARVRLDRNGRIVDDRVEALGERDVGIEVGATLGVSFQKLLNPFDSLSVSVDAVQEVAGGHGGSVISPQIGYSTPLSRALFAALSVSADHVSDDYADTYFDIDAAGSLASGLPIYDADGGFRSVGTNLLLGYDLDGDVTNGGFSLFALGAYSRLVGDAADTPTTSIAGSADQFFVAAGLSYTF